MTRVDTSAEAVHRLARVLDGRDGFAFTGINGNIASETLRALLAERDTLRRERDEARNAALEEAAREMDKWTDDIPQSGVYLAGEIRALKSAPAARQTVQEAAKGLVDHANGDFEDENGERAWMVPDDFMFALKEALRALAQEGQADE